LASGKAARVAIIAVIANTQIMVNAVAFIVPSIRVGFFIYRFQQSAVVTHSTVKI
jgi:hypothetical protein